MHYEPLLVHVHVLPVPVRGQPLRFTSPATNVHVVQCCIIDFPKRWLRWTALLDKPLTVRVRACTTRRETGLIRDSDKRCCAFRPNEPYSFRGRKATLNHAHAFVSACP